MQLRRAAAHELDAVGELTVEAYADFVMSSDAYVERLRDAGSRHREAELWVAEGESALLGCVTVCPPGSPWRELAPTEDATEGEFRMLAVDPVVRGRGVGEALTRLAIERARTHGASTVVLSSLAGMAAAHRLYERLGFRRVPERDWAPAPGVSLIAYRLALQELT